MLGIHGINNNRNNWVLFSWYYREICSSLLHYSVPPVIDFTEISTIKFPLSPCASVIELGERERERGESEQGRPFRRWMAGKVFGRRSVVFHGRPTEHGGERREGIHVCYTLLRASTCHLEPANMDADFSLGGQDTGGGEEATSFISRACVSGDDMIFFHVSVRSNGSMSDNRGEISSLTCHARLDISEVKG